MASRSSAARLRPGPCARSGDPALTSLPAGSYSHLRMSPPGSGKVCSGKDGLHPMKKHWFVAVACALALWAGTSRAQSSYLLRPALDTPSSDAGGRSLLGLFSSDRIHISNETSFSVLSGAGGSLSQGLNVTRLTYRDSHSPLSLSVGLGNRFLSSGSYFGYASKPGFFLHDLSLQYQAGGHSILTIQFQQVPGTRSPAYGNPAGFDELNSFVH